MSSSKLPKIKKPNVILLSNRQLAHAIVYLELPHKDRSGSNEPVSIKDIVLEACENIFFRQKCIDFLRWRLKRKFHQTIIDIIAKHDPEFACIFCEQHLGLKYQVQAEMKLGF
jgi:hypothetical protein